MEEAFRRDFSLKPKDASATIIASAICRHDSFSDRGSAAKTSRTKAKYSVLIDQIFGDECCFEVTNGEKPKSFFFRVKMK